MSLFSFSTIIRFLALFLFLSVNELTIAGSASSDIRIAPLHQALTFARINKNNTTINMAVLSYKNNFIHAVNLTSLQLTPEMDAVDLFNKYGYKELLNKIISLKETETITINANELIIPIELQASHIAAGGNFKAHSDETNALSHPFLFSKRVKPTSAFSDVYSTSTALDYEVELAFVPLEDMEEHEIPTYMGLILSNDFSKRDEIMHNVDTNNIESAKGFVQGKSGESLLPVGNLFVVPKDYKEFSQHLTLSLWVNEKQKQHANTSQMIWNIEDIIGHIWQNRFKRWNYQNQSIGLLEHPNIIRKRTLILSGTPQGTAFQGVHFSNKIVGIGNWLLGGFENSIQYHVVSDYLNQAKLEGRFLQPGDRVQIQSDYMGVLHNHIKSVSANNLVVQ